MAIGYRSFLSIDAGQSLIDAVVAQMTEWTTGKQIDVPVDRSGRHVLTDNDVITILLEREHNSRMYRWRRHHPFAQGAHEMSRTTVTAVEHPEKRGWLWTEIELPNDSELDPTGPATFMSVPSFLRSLIGTLSCHDGRAPVTAEPQWLALNHLPDLMDYLADDTRRGPVFVASQEGRGAREFEFWARDVMRELVGLGATFMVGGSVETALNEMVGPAHALRPGTVRTYQPKLNLDDVEDPRRHRTLGKDRIDHSSARQLGHMLGLAQRDQATKRPLPPEVLAANHVLAEKERAARGRPTIARMHTYQPFNPPSTFIGQQRSAGIERVESADHAAPAGPAAHGEYAGAAAGDHSDHAEPASVLRALQALEAEIRALRNSMSPPATNGHRRLNAL